MPTDAQRLLANLEELAARVTALASANEAARRLSTDLVESMRVAGVFRMFVPQSHGGLELDFPDSLPILETLAAADGAAGWVAMIGSHLPLIASALPRAGFDEIYSHGPDVIGAGSVTPAGTAQPAGDGYVVSGRWPFASGCQHADYLFGFCVVMKDGAPMLEASSTTPAVRAVFGPAAHWSIDDTWHAAGLRGTGSHHVRLDNVSVPSGMTFDVANGRANLPGPLYVGGPLALLPLHIGAIAVGLAEGAINDLVAAVSSGRRQLFARIPIRDSPLFQHELGRADAEVRAARSLLHTECGHYWSRVCAGEAVEPAWEIRVRQSMAWVAATCARAVDQCYTLGGGSALYDSSPLQRRLRDAHAVTQHVIVHQRALGQAGQLRLGLPAAERLRPDW